LDSAIPPLSSLHIRARRVRKCDRKARSTSSDGSDWKKSVDNSSFTVSGFDCNDARSRLSAAVLYRQRAARECPTHLFNPRRTPQERTCRPHYIPLWTLQISTYFCGKPIRPTHSRQPVVRMWLVIFCANLPKNPEDWGEAPYPARRQAV